jgi:hypothetical protein
MTTYYTLGSFGSTTREEWCNEVARTNHHLKAPISWIEQQKLAGRSPIAVFSIWAKYPLERKVAIWLMADDEDFERSGYLSP